MATTDRASTEAPAHDDSRRVSILLGALFGLAGMGSSSAAVTLPLLGPDLGVTPGLAAWTISLYVLMLAVTTALYGRSPTWSASGAAAGRLVLMTVGALVEADGPDDRAPCSAARARAGCRSGRRADAGVADAVASVQGDGPRPRVGRLAGTAAAISCLGPLAGGAGGVGARVAGGDGAAHPRHPGRPVPVARADRRWQRCRARHRRGGPGRLTAAGMVLLVQSPSAGIAVAAIGAGLLVLGVPAVSASVRRRPEGFLPVEVVRNAGRRAQRDRRRCRPASWFALLIALPAVLWPTAGRHGRSGSRWCPSAVVALGVPRVTGPAARPSRRRALDRGGRRWSPPAPCSVASLGAHWVNAPLLVARDHAR